MHLVKFGVLMMPAKVEINGAGMNGMVGEASVVFSNTDWNTAYIRYNTHRQSLFAIALLIDWLTALRHISTERLLVPRNVAK